MENEYEVFQIFQQIIIEHENDGTRYSQAVQLMPRLSVQPADLYDNKKIIHACDVLMRLNSEK